MALLLAAVHLVSLVFGVAALVFRASALIRAEDDAGVRRVLLWDNVLGVVAVFWIGSGVWRAFSDVEKGTSYYLSNHVFWTKMLVLLLFLSIEAVAMVAFIRFRVRLAKRQPIALTGKARLIRLHWLELALIPVLVVLATGMARGVGAASSRRAAEEKSRAAVTSAVQGEVIYRQHCATCHQLDGRGLGGKLAADFLGDPRRLAKSDAILLRSIAAGVPGTAMLGFQNRLTDEEQKRVLAYIRTAFTLPRAR